MISSYKWFKKGSLAVVLGMAGTIGALGLFGSASSVVAAPLAQGAQQGSSLVDSALAFGNAYNTRDTAGLRAMSDPSMEDVSHWGPPDQQVTTRDAFINGSPQGPHVSLTNCKQSDANTVSCDATLSAGPLPTLAHPFTETNTLTFRNGKVLRIDEYLSDQTAQELAAFTAANPQPGMPSTGSGDAGLPLAGLAAGLLLLSSGLAARRPRSVSE